MAFNFSKTAECSAAFNLAQDKWHGTTSNGDGETATPGCIFFHEDLLIFYHVKSLFYKGGVF